MRTKANRILVPVDGGEASEQAFRWSSQLARMTRSQLYALYVHEVPLRFAMDTYIAPRGHQGEDILSRIENIGAQNKCKVRGSSVLARNAGQAIVLEAEERGMDLIVVGTPAPRPPDAFSLGTTAAYVFKNATCQVILHREQVPG